jgi:hypothetical protein
MYRALLFFSLTHALGFQHKDAFDVLIEYQSIEYSGEGVDAFEPTLPLSEPVVETNVPETILPVVNPKALFFSFRLNSLDSDQRGDVTSVLVSELSHNLQVPPYLVSIVSVEKLPQDENCVVIGIVIDPNPLDSNVNQTLERFLQLSTSKSFSGDVLKQISASRIVDYQLLETEYCHSEWRYKSSCSRAVDSHVVVLPEIIETPESKKTRHDIAGGLAVLLVVILTVFLVFCFRQCDWNQASETGEYMGQDRDLEPIMLKKILRDNFGEQDPLTSGYQEQNDYA